MIKFRQKNFARIITRKSPMTRFRRIIGAKTAKIRRSVKNEANKAAMNPGKYVSDTTQYVLENPIASTGIAAGYSVAPVPGTTAVSIGAENLAKKVPIYKRVTKSMGELYKKSRIPEIIEPVINTGIEVAKNTPGIGI